MTIPQRILLQVAIGAGLVIAIATGVTYGIVYNSARQRALNHLETYVNERARREENGFKQVQGNLILVRGQFLKRMEGPLPNNIQGQWNGRFALFEDGSWRSRKEFSDGRKFSTLWANKHFPINQVSQTYVMRAQNICDELLPGWVDAFPSVYFVFPGWANIGFDARIPNWVWDTPADYDPVNLEWFRLALPTNKPSPNAVWSGVIEEPISKIPIVSVYLPIFIDDEFIGSIGHDLWVDRFMTEPTRSGLPGARHMIFRRDGRLIAHPTKRAEILSSIGMLLMQDSGDPALASLYNTIIARNENQFSGYDEVDQTYYSVARLDGPDWFFLTTMPRETLQRQAFQSAQWVLWSGLLSLAVLLGFLAAILRNQIAQPLAELTRATRQMSAGDITAKAKVDRADELGALASSFNEMSGRVASRDAELRQLNLELEQRVVQRTSELSEANRNLDKALSRERELSELKSEFVALVSHEFRTPLEIIMSSVDNLDRYHDRLTPEKRHQLLSTIHKSVRRMSGMMEEVLVLGRLETDRMTFHPSRFELRSFCQKLCEEIQAATGKDTSVRLEMDGTPEFACGDENLLRHIFTNLLSNAVKYSPNATPVDFRLTCENQDAIFNVIDHGCGIPEADQKRLFQAFHRGSNVRQIPGTGLGLLIVQRCVHLHNGQIEFQSAEGQGTTFTVRLPLFNQNELST